MRRATLIAAALALAACSDGQQGEIRKELAQLAEGMRGRVEPLPQVKPYEPVPYTAAGVLDPFRPDRLDMGTQGKRPTGSKLQPDDTRPKEPLEQFPLESIQMLGTITQNKEVYALVKAGPNLYRVKKGNYMGTNYGVITEIEEAQINLKELVQDGNEWVERTSSLQLVEAKR